MTTVTVTAGPDISLRQLGADTRYVLTGFPIGVLTCVGLTAMIAVGAVAGALTVSARVAGAERRRAARVLGRPLPAPAHRPAPEHRRWPALVHGLLRVVPSAVSGALVVTWWSAAVAGLSASLWDWAIPYGPRAEDLPTLIGLGSATETRIWLYMATGLLFALTLAPLVRAVARMEARFAERMLGRA